MSQARIAFLIPAALAFRFGGGGLLANHRRGSPPANQRAADEGRGPQNRCRGGGFAGRVWNMAVGYAQGVLGGSGGRGGGYFGLNADQWMKLV